MKSDRSDRRNFLRTMTVATGAAGLAPELYGLATAHPSPVPDVDSASAETGQTIKLAQYATKLRFEEIPADVLQRVKDCVADTVGVILFGSQFPWSKMIVAQARRMGSGGKCNILGTAASVSAPCAALAHGAMTHA